MDMAALGGWAGGLTLVGRYGEAVAAYEAIINRRGGTAAVYAEAAGTALMAGDPQKAERFCQDGLRHTPYDQSCLAMVGTAWRLQDNEQDEKLNGYDSLIRVFDLRPPDGFSNMEDFNAELGRYLE